MVASPTPARRRGRRPAKKVFYTLSERTRLFQWRPILVFPTRPLAEAYKEELEKLSPLTIQGYKIDTVELKERGPE